MDEYDSLPKAPAMMPLTPWGMRKIRRYDERIRAYGAIEVDNLAALNDADKTWLAEHGWNHDRETWDAMDRKHHLTSYY